jgi:hypothetical protein
MSEMWEASDVMGHMSWSGEIRWKKVHREVRAKFARATNREGT